MDSQGTHLTKDRARIESIFRNPPVFSADDIAEILATCLTPPPDTTVDVTQFQLVDSHVRSTSAVMSMADALAHYLSGALTEFLIDQALQSENPMDNIQSRLKVVRDAAEKFIGAIGLKVERNRAHIPWPIGKRFLYAMNNSQIRLSKRQGSGAADLDAVYKRILQYEIRSDEMNQMLSHVASIAHWAAIALRQEKSHALTRNRPPNLAFEHLVRSLVLIWQELLRQDLSIASKASRNANRWAPIPDSFQQFSLFFRTATKRLGVNFSSDELKEAFSRLKKAEGLKVAAKNTALTQPSSSRT